MLSPACTTACIPQPTSLIPPSTTPPPPSHPNMFYSLPSCFFKSHPALSHPHSSPPIPSCSLLFSLLSSLILPPAYFPFILTLSLSLTIFSLSLTEWQESREAGTAEGSLWKRERGLPEGIHENRVSKRGIHYFSFA